MHGYSDKILRVNLSTGEFKTEALDPETLRSFVGGTGLGARYLYDEVGPEVMWDSPDNRMMMFAGPLSGTTVPGTGLVSFVFKGPMTDMAGSTQAAGRIGAFLKLSGYDGVILEGQAPDWKMLHIDPGGQPHLLSATHLKGLNTRDTEQAVVRDLSVESARVSVFGIGPAGENLVRFACLAGEGGHVAARNGIGAVFGAKRLKAIAISRGKNRVQVADPEGLREVLPSLRDASLGFAGGILNDFGTAGLVGGAHRIGVLPVRNYTTNIYPAVDEVCGQFFRDHFEVGRATPCWACPVQHVRTYRIPEGPYAGFEGEEPEYEGIAACGPQIGVTEPDGVVVLCNEIDWLGMDINESGWLIGWVMECYERGLIDKADLGGIDLTWGNVEAVRELIGLIARREGPGEWLADGVMRASRRFGQEAQAAGIYTLKGNSPRGHDHRARWTELLDTICSNTSTIETSWGAPAPLPGIEPLEDPFCPEEVVRTNAEAGGYRQFEDCLVICRFCATQPAEVMQAVNLVTGWEMDTREMLRVGRRVINLLRMFNLRHGLDTSLEWPSPRYMSVPQDGPAQGRAIRGHLAEMRSGYWALMGWDPVSGVPTLDTVRDLGLDFTIDDLPLME